MAKRAKSPPPSKPGTRRPKSRYYIVELETFEGDDAACYLLGADPMWIVMSASHSGGAAVVDYGYRSVKDAKGAWPEAVSPEREPRARDRHRPIGWNRVPPVFSEPWFQDFWKKLKKAQPRGHRG